MTSEQDEGVKLPPIASAKTEGNGAEEKELGEKELIDEKDEGAQEKELIPSPPEKPNPKTGSGQQSEEMALGNNPEPSLSSTAPPATRPVAGGITHTVAAPLKEGEPVPVPPPAPKLALSTATSNTMVQARSCTQIPSAADEEAKDIPRSKSMRVVGGNAQGEPKVDVNSSGTTPGDKDSIGDKKDTKEEEKEDREKEDKEREDKEKEGKEKEDEVKDKEEKERREKERREEERREEERREKERREKTEKEEKEKNEEQEETEKQKKLDEARKKLLAELRDQAAQSDVLAEKQNAILIDDLDAEFNGIYEYAGDRNGHATYKKKFHEISWFDRWCICHKGVQVFYRDENFCWHRHVKFSISSVPYTT